MVPPCNRCRGAIGLFLAVIGIGFCTGTLASAQSESTFTPKRQSLVGRDGAGVAKAALRLDERLNPIRTPDQQADFERLRQAARQRALEQVNPDAGRGRVWNPTSRLGVTQKTGETTVFTVNSDYDDPDDSIGDGNCDDGFDNGTFDECTLRAAIQETNATPGADPVVIRIDMISIARGAVVTVAHNTGEDLWTLFVNTPASEDTFSVLPPITRNNVLIDATTQLDGSGVGSFPDAYCGQPVLGDTSVVKVALDGSFLTGSTAVGLDIQADNVEIRGLAFKNFPASGLYASGSDTLKVDCSYFGTDHYARSAEPNGTNGLAEKSGSNFRLTNSVASGNTFSGVVAESRGSVIDSSFIGLDVTGLSALGNLTGLYVTGDSVIVKRVFASGNDDGLWVTGDSAIVEDAFFGVGSDSTTAIANDTGIRIYGNGSRIGGSTAQSNTIAYNTGPGVRVEGTGTATIRYNRIFGNGNLGIDLGGDGVTPNDGGTPPDTDSGPNGLQNFPVISSATQTGPTSVEVSFDFESTPSTTFQFDYYRSATPDGSGNGEGAVWIATGSDNTDVNGDLGIGQVISIDDLPVGSWVTTTATNPSGQTSEFSNAIEVTGSSISLSNAKVFLEGPYSGGAMATHLLSNGYVPLAQPYGSAEFDGTLLEYDEALSVVVVPENVVDWVTLSLRSSTEVGSEVGRVVGFVKANGSLVDTDDNAAIAFGGVEPGDYYLIACQRNHTCAMSSSMIDFSGGTGTWDFTTGLSQGYTTGGAPLKDLGDGAFGLFAADANADGLVTAPDFNLWNAGTTAGEIGYRAADHNLDGLVTAPDFNLWNANTTAGAATRVP